MIRAKNKFEWRVTSNNVKVWIKIVAKLMSNKKYQNKENCFNTNFSLKSNTRNLTMIS